MPQFCKNEIVDNVMLYGKLYQWATSTLEERQGAAVDPRRFDAPGFVPAPPTMADAPLTRSRARQGLGNGHYNIQVNVLQRGLVPAVGSLAIVPLNVDEGWLGIRLGLHQVHNIAMSCAASLKDPCHLGPVRKLTQFLGCHLLSPDGWLPSTPILPCDLHGTPINTGFRDNKPRRCNAKINYLTRFSHFGDRPDTPASKDDVLAANSGDNQGEEGK